MRRQFAEFDDELQDSDQTLSAPARHGKPRARLPTVASASDRSSEGLFTPARRRFPSSAFFSDSTDDDFSRPKGRNHLSMSAYSRRDQAHTSRSLLHMSAGPGERRRRSRESVPTPRLHVDTIHFPVTRSVLWDRRPLSAAPIGVSLGQVLPHFIVSAEALKEIHRLYGDTSTVRANGAPLCYLFGNTTSPRAKKVFLEGVKLKREEARAAGVWCVPVHPVQDGIDTGLSQERYVANIAAVQSSYRDEYGDNVASKLQPKLLIFRSPSHAAQLDFQLECVASPVLFKFSLVRNLPLLMTPLAASLAKREFSTRSRNMRSGYVTLDRTRKAVPLLKVDPLVLQQPVVGVWVCGVQIDDAWDEETARRQLADPFLYFACLGYLMSGAIKERVGPEKNTFLVALYPDDSVAAGSLPRFFECSFSEYLLPPARPLPMELYSQRRSCLVGVSKFSTDVELTVSASPTTEWEAARRQAQIPTAPRLEDTQDPNSGNTRIFIDNDVHERSLVSRDIPSEVEVEEQSGDVTSGWTITADNIRKSAAGDLITHSHTSVQSEEVACNAPTSAEATAPEVEDKLAASPSTDDAHDMTSTLAATGTGTSPPNETEGVTKSRERLGNNVSSYPNCCKTQQLLTIQHQQILENQQRQLHKMQEQITQLRRLLKAARSHKQNEAHPTPNANGYDSDASSSSIGAVADVSTTLSRHGNGYLSSQSSMVSAARRSCDAPFSDKSSVHTRQENEKEEKVNEGKSDSDVSISSLGLSSISSGSGAELSSLSLSLADERLEQLGGKQAGTQQGGDEGLNRSHLSAGAEKQHVEVQTNVDALLIEADQEHEKDTSAHDLSIDELSASLNEKATRDADNARVALVDHDADFPDADATGSGNNCSIVERLLSPDAYLRKVGGFVDHHGGCFTTPPLDFHSFCVPRIKFSSEGPECSPSDSEDEEVRLIEQKYKRLMAV